MYFLIAFSTGSVSSITSVSKLSSFSIFISLTTFLKNSLKVSASFALHSKCPSFREELFWSLSNNFYLKINGSLSFKRFYYQLSSRCEKILKKDLVNPFFSIMSQERCGVFIFLSWQKSKFNRACFFGLFSSLVEVMSGLNDSFVAFGSKISFCFWISTNWITKTFFVTCFHTISTDRYLEILSGKRRF